MKILFIDDEAPIRELFVAYLGEEHEIELAENGEEGFQKASDFSYDLIISDISLPKRSGIELIEGLRQNNINTPFIIITGDSDIQIAISTFRLGAIDFFLKPFRMEALRTRVNSLNFLERSAHSPKGDLIEVSHVAFAVELKPKIKEVGTFVDHICNRFLDCKHLCEEDLFSIKIVLHELISNAIEHGIARFQYFDKKTLLESNEDYYSRVEEACQSKNESVFVEVKVNREGFALVVEDPGEGFDLNQIPNPIENPGKNLVSGRGIFLSKMNIDSILYNEKGNRVEVFKTWSRQNT